MEGVWGRRRASRRALVVRGWRRGESERERDGKVSKRSH